MTLRRALVVYLIVLHLLIAVLGGVVLWPESRRWILVLELTLLVSAWVGIYLVRSQSLPDRLASIASEWMRERDFSHALKAEGTADVRRLIEVYNGMVSKLREERLRNEEKEQFLQKVLEASPFGVITTDHDGRVRSMNPAAMTLLEVGEDELLGSSLSGAMKPFVRDLGAIPLGETRLLRIGSQRRVRGSHSRFYDRGFPRSFFQVEDLTQDLWEIEKASYDRVLRTLSHEVNNTLGATSSILESAKIFGTELNTESSDELNTALQVAIDRAANLNTFMRRYAEVVRVPVPVKQATKLGPVVERAARLIEPECHQRGILVVLDVDMDVPAQMVDVAQFEQVLTNVLRNAIEAVDQDGSIRLALVYDDGRVVFAVEDSGLGLSDEAQGKLFSPFFSTKPNGQGVGLMLVHEILTLHGLEFGIDSPEDGPTRFWIRFCE